ncbi:MAG TPA: FAD-dependent oxidoreductase, partial [Tepidiformaceae bacterium]|nr:FAD-dependent oxidoreductase [Tepidiformaceae bacterium]
MLSTSTSRVAIVGGGLAGLAAGISAARAGADVTLFERSKTLGGRAETHVEQGFHFNIGPHAVFHDSFELLRGLGVELTGGNPPLGRTVAWYRGKRYRLPLGGASMLATGLLGVRHKIEAGKFFATRLR